MTPCPGLGASSTCGAVTSRPSASRPTIALPGVPASSSSKARSMPSSPPSTPSNPTTCAASSRFGYRRRGSGSRPSPGSRSARTWPATAGGSFRRSQTNERELVRAACTSPGGRPRIGASRAVTRSGSPTLRGWTKSDSVGVEVASGVPWRSRIGPRWACRTTVREYCRSASCASSARLTTWSHARRPVRLPNPTASRAARIRTRARRSPGVTSRAPRCGPRAWPPDRSRRPRLRAPGAGVGPHLVVLGPEGRRLELGVARRLQSSERALHDAIFARVEGDHAESTADLEQRGRVAKRVAERRGLVVHGHPQGLECPRRDVQAVRPGRAGHRAPHGGDEVAGPPEWAPPRDRPGNPPRVRLLAVLDQDPRELGLGQPVHEVSGGLAAGGIEAHVERLVALEREAAPRRLELVRRHAEVEQERPRARDAVRLRRPPEVPEALPREAHALAEPREPRAGVPHCLGVHVEAQEPDGRGARHQQRLGMTTHSHRPIDHPSFAARSQEKGDLVDEHRNVNYFTPTCQSQVKSEARASPCDRSYSSNRLRSQISKKSRPRPTSVTSFPSPACSRLSDGSRMRPAPSSSTSFAREIQSRPTRRSRSSNCD